MTSLKRTRAESDEEEKGEGEILANGNGLPAPFKPSVHGDYRVADGMHNYFPTADPLMFVTQCRARYVGSRLTDSTTTLNPDPSQSIAAWSKQRGLTHEAVGRVLPSLFAEALAPARATSPSAPGAVWGRQHEKGRRSRLHLVRVYKFELLEQRKEKATETAKKRKRQPGGEQKKKVMSGPFWGIQRARLDMNVDDARTWRCPFVAEEDQGERDPIQRPYLLPIFVEWPDGWSEWLLLPAVVFAAIVDHLNAQPLVPPELRGVLATTAHDFLALEKAWRQAVRTGPALVLDYEAIYQRFDAMATVLFVVDALTMSSAPSRPPGKKRRLDAPASSAAAVVAVTGTTTTTTEKKKAKKKKKTTKTKETATRQPVPLLEWYQAVDAALGFDPNMLPAPRYLLDEWPAHLTLAENTFLMQYCEFTCKCLCLRTQVAMLTTHEQCLSGEIAETDMNIQMIMATTTNGLCASADIDALRAQSDVLREDRGFTESDIIAIRTELAALLEAELDHHRQLLHQTGLASIDALVAKEGVVALFNAYLGHLSATEVIRCPGADCSCPRHVRIVQYYCPLCQLDAAQLAPVSSPNFLLPEDDNSEMAF